MMKRIERMGTGDRVYRGRHRREHWYIDNQVYFITARCRDKVPAFQSEAAKSVFWDRFNHYTKQFGFTPWVTSLMSNHYHTLGYLREGNNLGPMMQRIHGSVAKLVNDLLLDQGGARLTPFWKQSYRHDYFDGAIRDEKQARRAYRYSLKQGERHGVIKAGEVYPHTRVRIEIDRAIKRSHELKAFLEGVPYKRYQRART